MPLGVYRRFVCRQFPSLRSQTGWIRSDITAFLAADVVADYGPAPLDCKFLRRVVDRLQYILQRSAVRSIDVIDWTTVDDLLYHCYAGPFNGTLLISIWRSASVKQRHQ